MAIQLNFTTEQDINLPETYWMVSDMRVNLRNSSATCTFTGYKDKKARDAGKHPIGSREYYVSGDEFIEFYTKVIDKEINLAEFFYSLAKTRKDVPTNAFTKKDVVREVKKITLVEVEGEDQEIEEVEEITTELVTESVDDQRIIVSFFKGSKDV